MTEDTEPPPPRVSVVITTNNRKAWVTLAIESVFHQTYRDFEVLVVDDGSKDGTSEHLQSVFGDRIRLFRTGGTNAPTAKNLGASHACGQYLAFLDDDDLWYPEKLEKQVAVMEAAGPEIAMVGGACDYMTQEGAPTLAPSYPDDELTYERACIQPLMPGGGSTCFMRRAVFEQFGGFDTRLTRNQDRDLWIKITREYRVPMLQDVLGTIRLHQTQRRGVNTDVIERCRLAINARIPERSLRRKADAWTYFQLFNRNWSERKFKAIGCLLRSFLAYPFPLPVEKNRLRMATRKVLNR